MAAAATTPWAPCIGSYGEPGLSAEQIARQAIEAAAEFDDGTGLPITSFTVRLIALMRQRNAELRHCFRGQRGGAAQCASTQANKEISNRFDFKGSDARVEQAEHALTLYADDDFKLGQVYDVLIGKLAKRGVDVRVLEKGNTEKIGGDKVKQAVTVRTGVSQELAKKLVKQIKDSKLKVQASIQGEAVRVSGAKKDVLQEAIQLVRKSVTDFPLQFTNFRD